MNAAVQVIMNLSLRDHVKPAVKQLHWLPVEKKLHTSCVCSCITSTLDKHHSTCQTVYLQFLHSVADTGWGRLAQRITFCQEQELDLENAVSPTVAQPPGTIPSDLHDITDTGTFRKRLKSVLFDRAYSDWCSWTCRIAAPYKFHVDWLIVGWQDGRQVCNKPVLRKPKGSDFSGTQSQPVLVVQPVVAYNWLYEFCVFHTAACTAVCKV